MRPSTSDASALRREIRQLKARLAEAEETLSAIRHGDVDAVVVSAPAGNRIFTLESAERPYRILIEQMLEGAVTLAPDGTILYCNRHLAELLRTPLEMVLGGRFVNFVTLGDRAAFAALLAAARGQITLTLRAADGRGIPVQLAANSLSADGISGVCLVVTDLTQQVQVGELLAAERLARSILDHVTEAIVVCDLSGDIIRCSRVAKDLIGHDPLGEPFASAFPLQTTDSAAPTGADLVRAARGGKVLRGVEATLAGRQGVRTIVVSAGPVYGAEERVVACVLSLTDISQRKQTEEALHKLNETLEEHVRHRTSLITLLHDVASAANAADSFEAAVQTTLRRVCEQFGWCCGHALRPTADDPDVLAPVEMFYKESACDFEPIRAITQNTPLRRGESLPGRVLETGKPEWTTDLRQHLLPPRLEVAEKVGVRTALAIPVLDGEDVLAVLEFFSRERVPPDERSLAAMSGIGLQLGQLERRRRIERRLRHAERLSSLGTFAAGIAHEINNPLAAILLTARHAAKIVQRDPAEAKAALEEIIADTQRCGRIVSGVLRFARREPSEKKPVRLAEVVQGAYEQGRKIAGDAGVRLKLRLPESLPTISANATDLEQALGNLIANAVHASRPRQIVTLGVEPPQGHVRLWVKDHGCGMTAEACERAFDPFYTTRAHEGGTGLGLSMVHGIVIDHGGTIRLDSRPGNGTIVTIVLPGAVAAGGGKT